MLGELFRQACHGAFGLGGHQQARCVFIKPMHDAGPRFAANAHKIGAAMGDQGIDQCAVGIARRRMYHQPRRLFDHDQFLVFKHHRQGNVLAARAGGHGGRHIHLPVLARFDPVVGVFYRLAVQRHCALFQQLLQA